MKKVMRGIFVVLGLMVFMVPVVNAKASLGGYLSMGYINWAGTMPAIDWNTYSHVIDAFGIPASNGTISMTAAGKTGITGPAHTNSTYALISLGGSGNSSGFSGACTAANRVNFVNNIYALLALYGYDGVDIDWEYPAATDTDNFTATMLLLYNKLQTGATKAYDSTTPILTFYTTTGANDQGFDFGQLGNYCDYAIQSGYDWGNNYNAPLRWFGGAQTGSADKNGKQWTFESSIYGFYKSMTNDRGFPPAKVILGLPTYGEYGKVSAKTAWNAHGTFSPPYDTMAKEGSYGGLWFTDVQGWKDKIDWAKQMGMKGTAMWSVNNLAGTTDISNAIKSESSLTIAAFTPTPVYVWGNPKMISNYEDGQVKLNNVDGLVLIGADTGGTGAMTVTADAYSGNVAGLYTADLTSSTATWPGVIFDMPVTPVAGADVNYSNTAGIRFAMKGNASTGSTVAFRVGFTSPTITDGSYPFADITANLSNSYTLVTIPWSSFLGNWGASAVTATVQGAISTVKSLRFIIILNTLDGKGTANGNKLYVDDLQIMCAIPTATVTATGTTSATVTITPTYTPQKTATSTPTFTKTSTATYTKTASPTATVSYTGTQTNTVTATKTATPTATDSNTITQTNTATATKTNTPTATASNTPPPTNTTTQTNTSTPTNTCTVTATATKTATATVSPVFTPTITQTHTASPTMTETSTPTGTFTMTSTTTVTGTVTPTFTVTNTSTITETSTNTPIVSPTPTFTHTETVTETSTNTVTQTSTETATPTNTFTVTFTTTITLTLTNTPTITHTVLIPSATSTPTITATAVNTNTPGISGTPTPVSHDVVWPNPWNEGEDITVRLKKVLSSSVCTVKLYTAAYRLVYQYTLPLKQTGDLIIVNKEKAPTNLASGVYYLVVEPDNATKTIIKLIALKKGN
ncbi:MAG: glycosyl hydrolase family 18 protein [bacterium]